jgi:alpha-methylacyl-CoA racemase
LRGAEQFELDLKHPQAKEVYLRIISKADIVVEGFRPGVADRLGIGYKDLCAVNERLIYCAATGYGQDGPYAQNDGLDINYQAIAGGLALCGRSADGTPALPGMTLADGAGGGWQAAMRILAALVERQRTGRGKFLDVSAAEGVLQLMSVAIDEELATGQPSAGGMVYGGNACYGIFATADGKAVAIGAIETKFFRNLCKMLGFEHLAERQYVPEAQPELFRALTDAFKTRTRDEWVTIFAGVEACFAPVLSIDEVIRDRHFRARGMFVEYDHPQAGHACQVGPLGGGDWRGPAPDANKSACREVLGSHGFAAAEIDSLQVSGIVR